MLREELENRLARRKHQEEVLATLKVRYGELIASLEKLRDASFRFKDLQDERTRLENKTSSSQPMSKSRL